MKIKIKITNLTNSTQNIKYEPSGDFKYLGKGEDIFIELQKNKEGYIDIIIDETNSIMFVENDAIYINKIDSEHSDI